MGLNGSQFSCNVAADSLQIVVQGYDSATIATYNDAIWAKYQLGAKYGVMVPGPTSRPSPTSSTRGRRLAGAACRSATRRTSGTMPG
jgi:hypothetical protein